MYARPTILVVDPAPDTQTALQWAWVECRVLACSALRDAAPVLTRERPRIVVLELGLEGVEELYDSSPALRERLLFVSEGALTLAQRRLAARTGVPLLYKPLSLSVLRAAYEAFRPPTALWQASSSPA